MPSEADYRNAMFSASQAHGAMSQEGLTKESIAQTEKDIKANERLQAIIKEADERKIVLKDDPLFMTLLMFFMPQAKTNEGKERALRMAIATTQKINKEFTVQKKS